MSEQKEQIVRFFSLRFTKSGVNPWTNVRLGIFVKLYPFQQIMIDVLGFTLAIEFTGGEVSEAAHLTYGASRCSSHDDQGRCDCWEYTCGPTYVEGALDDEEEG